MRTLALLLVSILPCAVAVAAPSNTPSNVSTVVRPIRVTLVNMSGQRRQIRLKSGVLDLPFGVWVDIDSRVGTTLYIVSDTHASVDEQIVIKGGDVAPIYRIQ
jgi:hypothetical protein